MFLKINIVYEFVTSFIVHSPGADPRPLLYSKRLLWDLDLGLIEILEGQRGLRRSQKVFGGSQKVKEGQERSWMVFSHHWNDYSGEKSPFNGMTIKMRKVIGGVMVGWWPVGLQCQPQSQSLSSGHGLKILDFEL